MRKEHEKTLKGHRNNANLLNESASSIENEETNQSSPEDSDKIKKTDKRKSHTDSKYTYKELGVPDPKDFDYTSYKKDWCRYCGARFSGGFSKGPW